MHAIKKTEGLGNNLPKAVHSAPEMQALTTMVSYIRRMGVIATLMTSHKKASLKDKQREAFLEQAYKYSALAQIACK